MEPMEIALQDLERWDQQLLELVKDEQVDPWQIDLEVLTQKYLERLNNVLDYRIPARALITTAVLLKLKADTLEWYEDSELVFNDAIEFPTLENPPTRQPKRKITLIELVQALKEVMIPSRTRLSDYAYDLGDTVWQVKPFDMNEYVEEVEREIAEMLEKGSVAFEDFKKKMPLVFFALLYLAHMGKISLNQKGWNKEILIQKA